MSVDKLYKEINELPPDLKKDLFERLNVKKMQRRAGCLRSRITDVTSRSAVWIIREVAGRPYGTGGRIKRICQTAEVESVKQSLKRLTVTLKRSNKVDNLVGLVDGPTRKSSQAYGADLARSRQGSKTIRSEVRCGQSLRGKDILLEESPEHIIVTKPYMAEYKIRSRVKLGKDMGPHR